MTSYDKWLDEITEHVRKKKIAETAATFSVERAHEAVEELKAEFRQFMANNGARFVNKGEVGDMAQGAVGYTILVDEPICPEFTVFNAAWSAPVDYVHDLMHASDPQSGYSVDIYDSGEVSLRIKDLLSFRVHRDNLANDIKRIEGFIAWLRGVVTELNNKCE